MSEKAIGVNDGPETMEPCRPVLTEMFRTSMAGIASVPKLIISVIIAVVALVFLSASARAQTVAFTNDPVATTYGGASDMAPGLNIGDTFNVSGAGIEVFQLGAFDWQGDGLAAAHTVTLFSNQTALASVTVPAGTSAPLLSGFRFQPLAAPIYLSVGSYAVVSYQMDGKTNAASDPYGENNAAGFNGGGNVSPADGIFEFTTDDSPAYPNQVAGGYDFQSASFTYTNVIAGAPTWTGGGADNNWSTPGNWSVPLASPAALTFAGNAGLTNSNDLFDFTATGITFDSAAGAFVLNGNDITLSGNIGFNGNPAAPINQTINFNMAWNANEAIDTPANGNLVLGGNITSGNLLTKTDGGTLTLGGTNTFGALNASGGTNIITGNTTFTGNGGDFYLANGDFINGCKDTLVIQPGATLIVTGNYGDSGVIGRDSGSGTVIQNGGLFSFNPTPPSGPYLFVGASVSTATRSEYDMNDGVLDLNGNTLGIALGAGAVITGAVNQVSGVITNVSNLYFDPLISPAQGYGIYNLTGGSIYIGSGGITVFSGGSYEMNLGGGTIGAEASWSSSLNMNLTDNNGPVTFNPAGNTITLSGTLSGSGGLTVDGGGVLELSGANTYAGDTTIDAGSILQLDVTGSSAGAFSVANGGVLYLNYSGTYVVGSFYTNGVALPIGTYNSGNLSGFITGSGNLQVASGISSGLWTGGGADNNWSTAENWDNNAVPVFPHALTFAGNSQLNNNNDLSGITIGSLTFDSTAGAFELNGNDITLSGNIGFNGNPAEPITQTVNLNTTWNADKTIDTPTNGNLTLGGNITASANQLTKTDAGTLTLGGNDSFAGYTLNSGTNIITGNVTVNGIVGNGDLFYLGNASTNYNGTLVIQPGAALNVTGSFGDALVIGRNGGSGTVIQNGGTFTYNCNESYLYVGATSEAGTRAEYDMNGGVLDLNGNTLGVALGDDGVVYTATLNQIGGDINNILALDLGASRGYGHGVYTLSGGSITIDFGGIISSGSGSYQINLGGGTIAASSSWSSSLNMNLTNLNGSVTFDPAGNTITLSGNLSGNGGLIVTNSGTLELSGTSTYMGDTIVSPGTVLQLDTTGSSQSAFRLTDGAMLNLTYTGNYVVTQFYTNGVALPVGTYNAGNLPNFITGSGSLQVASGISTGRWTGLGADNNWSTANNWDNGAVPVFPIALTFAGNSQLANNNDLTGVTANSITFDSAAGAFTLDGNSLGLNGNISFNGNPVSPVNQTINLPLTPGSELEEDVRPNGNITMNGDITGSGTELTQIDPDGNLGVLTLAGTNSLKGLVINNGTNIITGTTTITGIGGSSFFYLADSQTTRTATMIIENGANLTVTGPFQDAAVIGRNGGIGTVIQNGGTFNFNINDGSHGDIFVGASGSSNTRAEYDMNGGVLNMNGYTLGIALGAGVVVTGVVNQVGGVITNVGNLYLDPNFAQGYGIYNLTGGSIYIGSGGITVFSGGSYELNLGGGTIGAYASWPSALNMNLTGNNGPVTFNPSGNTITLSGILSGNGGLTVSGGGTLELSGANTYTGDTTISNGTLQLDTTSSSSGAFRIATGGMLSLNYSGTINVSSLYTNGVALPVGIYNAANLSSFIANSGNLQVTGAIPSSPTNINYNISSGQITLSWPDNYKGWVLQQQTNALSIGLSTNWVDVDGSANVTSTNIPINPAIPATFYRLRYPTP